MRRDTTRGRSSVQERAIADRTGARLVPGSGSSVEKGDVRDSGFSRTEAKVTRADSFRVTKDDLFKLDRAAASAQAGEIPVFVVGFEVNGRIVREVYVIDAGIAESLLEKARG